MLYKLKEFQQVPYLFTNCTKNPIHCRMNDAQSVALITADESLRGGKRLRLKDTADAAVKGSIQIVYK